jgi:hypothetical protein
VKQEKKSLNV